jgi:hypothetical protein
LLLGAVVVLEILEVLVKLEVLVAAVLRMVMLVDQLLLLEELLPHPVLQQILRIVVMVLMVQLAILMGVEPVGVQVFG